jgi:thiamine-phosphate pyrophosphorylase
MTRRQTEPRCWLIADRQPGQDFWRAVRRLPREAGVLILCRFPAADRLRLRHIAKVQGLVVLSEAPRSAIRVHHIRELRNALLKRAPLVLLSPIARTASHPEWQPLARMRAATFARLAKRRLVALGGMNAKRYAKVERLGFVSWAGISAFKT